VPLIDQTEACSVFECRDLGLKLGLEVAVLNLADEFVEVCHLPPAS
jgi:hypothetical protein